MKRILFSVIVLMLTIAAAGQTLKVTTSSGTKEYQASQVTANSPAYFTGGTTLTVGNDMFTISDITNMVVVSSTSDAEDNTVNIIYNGSTATVTMADNVSSYVTAEVSGAHVTITQSNTDAVDGDEITYILSGSTADGSLTLDGSYKCSIDLAGVSITNPSGAAINITNSKRIEISAKKGTENTLVDGANGEQKACLYSKGQIQLKGNGTLNVVGKTKHAIKSGDYIEVKNLTLNISSAVADGINCEEYFLMKSGTVTISGVNDDGIQCDLGGDTSTGEIVATETVDAHEDEDSGNIYIEGGTLNITNSAAGGKGIKAEGDIKFADGDVNVSVTGSNVRTGSDTTAAKGIKADGSITINGGNITAYAKNHEAIESKSTIVITGGSVCATSSDDAINSAGDMTISGGYIYARSTGNDGIDANGNCYVKGGLVYAIGTSSPEVAIDANTEEQKKLYVSGGTLIAIGGLESGSSLSQSCYSTNSWNKSTWYALTVGSDVFAFQTPSNGGSTMVVSGASQPTLKSGVTVSSGTEIFGGAGYIDATVTGGTAVSLSSYTGGGGFGPGGNGPGGSFGPGGGSGPGRP